MKHIIRSITQREEKAKETITPLPFNVYGIIA